MISGIVVVDASVVVEYLVELAFCRQATRLFAGLLAPHSELELWAPDLIYPESVSALRKLVERKAVSPRAGAAAVERLVRLPVVATGTAGLMAEAWRLRGAISPYDACYVALAARLQVPLVTADARLVRALARRPPAVIFLGELE